MIAADHDRRLQLARAHQAVHGHAEFRALAVAQPADARRQALKVDALARQRQPARQRFVVRKQLERQAVGAVDVLGIAGERHPAERPAAFAEQRADVLGHEAGNVEGVAPRRPLAPACECCCRSRRSPRRASAAPAWLRRARPWPRCDRARYSCGSRARKRARLFQRHAVGHVAVQRIVRAGLVGEHVGDDAAARQFRQHVRAVAHQPHGDRVPAAPAPRRSMRSASSRLQAMRSQ